MPSGRVGARCGTRGWSDARLPSLGHMLWLIPGHCDPTVNLYDFLIGVRGGLMDGVVERIMPVFFAGQAGIARDAARGAEAEQGIEVCDEALLDAARG